MNCVNVILVVQNSKITKKMGSMSNELFVIIS